MAVKPQKKSLGGLLTSKASQRRQSGAIMDSKLQPVRGRNEGGSVDANTDQNIQMFKKRLKQKGINELYSAADSLGVRLPSGIGKDSAVDVIVNEVFYRTKIPIRKRKDTFTFEKELPRGGKFGLHANPKNKSGGISLTKTFKKGGMAKKKGMGTKWERKWG